MANREKLIWRGNPKCRSLCTRSPSGPKFYLEGEEIPAGTLAPALEATMIADKRIERVAATVALPTLAATSPAPLVQVAVVHGDPHPLSIAMLGAPAALEALGDSADLLDLLPLEQSETDLPMPAEPLPVPHNPAADMKPATAPVRAREGQGKKQKGKKK